MANHCRLSSATAISVCDALVDYIEAVCEVDYDGRILLYSGTEPAYCDHTVPPSNDDIVAICGLQSTAYIGAAADGANHWADTDITATAQDTDAIGSAAPVTFFRIDGERGGGVHWGIIQGTVGTSGCDLNLNSTVIGAGASVSITSLEVRIPYNQA